jgi:hypothetical protein
MFYKMVDIDLKITASLIDSPTIGTDKSLVDAKLCASLAATAWFLPRSGSITNSRAKT